VQVVLAPLQVAQGAVQLLHWVDEDA